MAETSTAATAAAAAELSPVARIARAEDPDRFLCALFAPAERREALFALIAFNHELARARAVATHPMAALIRLQWWRDTVEHAAAHPARPPRRHEVAAPLAAAIRAAALDPAELIALIDARAVEAEEDEAAPIPTPAAFAAYLRGTAGRLAVLAGRLLGAPDAALAGLMARGTAYGAAGVLRAVPALARQGRCLLPVELLAAHGLTPEAVIGPPPPPLGGDPAPLRPVIAALLAPEAGLRAPPPETLPRAWIAAALPGVLARRDARRLLARGIPAGHAAGTPGRGIADRLAVTAAALRRRA